MIGTANKEITGHVESYLRVQKSRGVKLDQALSSLKQGYFTSSEGEQTLSLLQLEEPEINHAIRPSHLAKAAVTVYSDDGLTPLQVAQSLKEWPFSANDVALGLHHGYDTLTATETGRLLLDPTIYPHLTPVQMREALTYAGFSEKNVNEAVNSLYQSKKTFTVQSIPKWQSSGVTIEADERVFIRYTGGMWTANPATGMVGPDGNANYVAKPGYTLPGAQEGALCGKVGNTIFLVGSNATVPNGLTGPLEFCINDDLRGIYGAGFPDNQGNVAVEITEQKR